MELKDFLPLVGILIGWMLAEGSAHGKREIERRRVIGRALSVLYFLFQEMAQLKQAQERFKNQTQDVKEWERLRQRSFEKYTVQDPEFFKKITATADSVGEYYPMEAYQLRELVQKYEFVKSKKLDALTSSPKLYVHFLSGYEMGFMAHQYRLELIIRFLARKQSTWLWLRMIHDFWRMRRRVPKGDLVFLQQVKGYKRKAAEAEKSSGSVPDEESDAMTSAGACASTDIQTPQAGRSGTAQTHAATSDPGSESRKSDAQQVV